jgi:hypothetical protein
VVQKFQSLLVKGDSLLTGDALRKLVVFPFTDAKPAPGANGGATKAAVSHIPLLIHLFPTNIPSQNVETFPILSGLGISTTLGFLEPCGINTPHVHPRATEFLTLTSGKNLRFGYILENGLVKAGQNPEISGYLNQFEGTVFPQGSIHYQFNDNCDKATFVAVLNNEDPGTLQIAQSFYALNAGVINATLGFPKSIDGKNIEEFRKMIPSNLAQDIDGCLAKCKKN